MTKNELLVLKLIEECAEVQQRASKMMQFGEDESQATAPRNLGGDNPPAGTNRDRLQYEINDLCAVVNMLGFRYPSGEEVDAKVAKIERYLQYSLECGTVAVGGGLSAMSTPRPINHIVNRCAKCFTDYCISCQRNPFGLHCPVCKSSDIMVGFNPPPLKDHTNEGVAAPLEPQIDDAFVEQIEDALGMGHGAWDMVDSVEICKAVAAAVSKNLEERADYWKRRAEAAWEREENAFGKTWESVKRIAELEKEISALREKP